MSSIVQIKDSAYDGLQSLRVYGNTVQNLWVNPTTETKNGVTFTSNADGSMTISGTPTRGNFDFGASGATGARRYILKPNTTYVLSVDKKFSQSGIEWQIVRYSEDSRLGTASITNNGATTVTFTTESNFSYGVFLIYFTSSVSTTTPVSGTYRVMLNEGSTAEPWCPPGLNSVGQLRDDEKNLWVNPNTETKSGVTLTANSDGTITLSGTNTANVTIQKPVSGLKPNTAYYLDWDRDLPIGYFCVGINGGAAIKSSRGTFTTGSDVSNLVCAFVVTGSQGTATFSGTYKVMLNEGSIENPWVPPESESCVQVVTAGKNLCKTSSASSDNSTRGLSATVNDDGTYHISGTTTGSYASPVKKVYVKLTPGTYTLSGNLASNNAKGYIYAQIYIDGMYYAVNNTSRKNTFNIKRADTYEISFTAPVKGASFDGTLRVQLELGSTATAYEPPNITTTHIDLQGHTLNALPDGTRDELHIDGGGNVVLEKKVRVVTAPTAAESWSWSTDVSGGRASFATGKTPVNIQGSQAGRILCDKFPPRRNLDDPTYVIVASNNSRCYVRSPAITNTATAATVAGGMTVLYPLAEPQTIDLGTIDLLKLRKKPLVNTIWANGTAEGTGFSLAPEIDCEYNRWSTYCDGFKTHGKHSYFDMGCCLAARDTGTPEKKSVTATVPYMSGFYDFSKLYGAIAFEARQLTYRFEFVEDSREELQQKKSQFLEWLSQVHDEEIADDDIPGRHFIGSLSEWEFEEGEEGQSGSLEVTFNCQPFLEADEDTTKTCNAGSNTVTVEGQPVNAYAKTNSGTATIQIGGATQSVGTTEIRLSVQLQPGDNAVTVTGSPVVLRWKELTA